MRVLFVCTGNVCRSAFAERLARSRFGLSDDVVFESAGTRALSGAAMDADMTGVLRRYGGSEEAFRARQLTAQVLDRADLVLTMTRNQRAFVLDEQPRQVSSTFTLAQFAQVAMAEEVRTLSDALGRLRRERRSPDPSLDIEDPYRRGAHVSERVGITIAELLEPTLRLLRPPTG